MQSELIAAFRPQADMAYAAAARAYNIPVEAIKSTARETPIVLARHAAVWLMWDVFHWPVTMVGQIIGVHWKTANNSLEQVENLVATDTVWTEALIVARACLVRSLEALTEGQA